MFLLGFPSGLRAQTDSAVSKLAPVVKTEAYGKLPLSFEANHGQTDAQVRFLSRGNGYSLFLTDSAAVLSLQKGELRPKAAGLMGTHAPQPSPVAIPKTDVVRMELAGAQRGLRVEGAEKLPGAANYFIGSDPAKWRSAVPTYAKVRYGGVYPGVDLVYYGNQSQLEYDFVVAPPCGREANSAAVCGGTAAEAGREREPCGDRAERRDRVSQAGGLSGV